MESEWVRDGLWKGNNFPYRTCKHEFLRTSNLAVRVLCWDNLSYYPLEWHQAPLCASVCISIHSAGTKCLPIGRLHNQAINKHTHCIYIYIFVFLFVVLFFVYFCVSCMRACMSVCMHECMHAWLEASIMRPPAKDEKGQLKGFLPLSLDVAAEDFESVSPAFVGLS